MAAVGVVGGRGEGGFEGVEGAGAGLAGALFGDGGFEPGDDFLDVGLGEDVEDLVEGEFVFFGEFGVGKVVAKVVEEGGFEG